MEPTIDAAELNKTAGSSDARCLLLVGRLVVVGHGLGFTLIPKNGAGVASVRHNYAAIGCDKSDYSRAARRVVKERWVGAKVLICFQEDLLQRGLVVARL